MLISSQLTERFSCKVSIQGMDDCWEWLASLGSAGYGQFNVDGRPLGAHRVAYTIAYGLIPEGLHVLHTCDNTLCVNPIHLFLGTQLDNMKDKEEKGRALRGEENGYSKLSASNVRSIRGKYATGRYTQRRLADEFGIAVMTVNLLLRCKTWKHVPRVITRSKRRKQNA